MLEGARARSVDHCTLVGDGERQPRVSSGQVNAENKETMADERKKKSERYNAGEGGQF